MISVEHDALPNRLRIASRGCGTFQQRQEVSCRRTIGFTTESRLASTDPAGNQDLLNDETLRDGLQNPSVHDPASKKNDSAPDGRWA
jgi:hypothetical protein